MVLVQGQLVEADARHGLADELARAGTGQQKLREGLAVAGGHAAAAADKVLNEAAAQAVAQGQRLRGQIGKIDDLHAAVAQHLCKAVMLRLRAAQVGNVVKQKALHRIGDELLQLPAGALQQDFLQRADFASHINGHADRSSYQKFLSLPLILLSVSRFFSKRNSFSAAILSVLRISMQEIQQNADKFLQLPAPCFSTVFQSPVFPKKYPSRRIWERHKYSQKFFSERRRIQTAEKRYSRSFGGKSVIGTKGPAEQFHQAVWISCSSSPIALMTVSNIGTSP